MFLLRPHHACASSKSGTELDIFVTFFWHALATLLVPHLSISRCPGSDIGARCANRSLQKLPRLPFPTLLSKVVRIEIRTRGRRPVSVIMGHGTASNSTRSQSVRKRRRLFPSCPFQFSQLKLRLQIRSLVHGIASLSAFQNNKGRIPASTHGDGIILSWNSKWSLRHLASTLLLPFVTLECQPNGTLHVRHWRIISADASDSSDLRYSNFWPPRYHWKYFAIAEILFGRGLVKGYLETRTRFYRLRAEDHYVSLGPKISVLSAAGLMES